MDGIHTYIVLDKLEGLVTVWKTKWIELYPRGKKRLLLNANALHDTAAVLEEAYRNYVINDISGQSDAYINVKFGKFTEISGGYFIHNNYENKKIVKSIPLNSIKGIIYDNEGISDLRTETEMIQLTHLWDPNPMNFNILVYIVNERLLKNKAAE